jgi:hypothetical protein
MVVISFKLLRQSNYHTGDLREALIDSATIGKVIVLMMPSDLNFEVHTAAVDAISRLAGHGINLLQSNTTN